jgi:MFS transporter, PAT family, beta-lactamase induction signal transducer AmpG
MNSTATASLKNANALPPLAEHSFLRYTTFIVLYFSQGIPEGITIFAIPAWMAMNGKSAGEIAGYSAVIMIPFSLKIVLAPFMERYTFLPMGRRKPWMLFGQFGILCSLLALSFVPEPLSNLSILTTVAVCVHIFILFQDIATDSLVIDIVPLEQQGKANSLMWGAKVVGTSLSLGLGSWLINSKGFSFAVSLMAVCILFFMLVPLLLRERKGERLLPWSNGNISPEAARLKVDSWDKLFNSFKQVLLLRNLWFLVFITFIIMAAVHYMRTLLPIFTIKSLGWDNVFYSKTYSTSNLVGGLVGMVTGGIIIYRFGIIRMLQCMLFITAVVGGMMAFSVASWQNKPIVIGFIAAVNICIVLLNIGVLALAMQMCWRRISAVQFTFCMTVFNGALATGAAFLGLLRNHFGWQVIFIVFSSLMILAMLLLNFIKVKKHLEQVEALEQNYLKNNAGVL